MVEKPRQQVLEATGHIACAVSEQRWMCAAHQLLVSMYTVKGLSQGMVPPTVGGSSPPSPINTIKAIPTDMPISQLILEATPGEELLTIPPFINLTPKQVTLSLNLLPLYPQVYNYIIMQNASRSPMVINHSNPLRFQSLLIVSSLQNKS